ncbi:NAD-dependent deacetylase [Desulfonauticus submarinus]|uniref:protein acetyllysine N-acetyltransferase n=1 Tax=Desulfonauticus submarinus TaxID=206665 RepID=A0A1G9ZJ04_9BACT|nr:NAD-dependent deacylase [Desulfonauticus submarinus]SDN21105.1 NAD-dependent deacetylase [Desulfonauticus submarinus]
MDEKINKAAQWIKEAKYVVAFTGAGISVPSGIPDFRSPGGLWSHFDPWQVCSDWALQHNPKGVWEFLLEAVFMFNKAEPNPAHLSLAELERRGVLKCIITQNIDGLHQRAGSKNVIEFHGGCTKFYCNDCGKNYSLENLKKLTRENIPWMCTDCGSIVRPDIVFFGEQIPPSALFSSQEHCSKADLMLIIGTSGEVAPANTLPTIVKQNSGKIIEINLGETAYESVSDIRFNRGAEEVLPLIVSKIGGKN